MIMAPWRRFVGVVLAGLMLGPLAQAQAQAQAPVQATVDRAVVRDNESFTLVLRAEGAVRGEPEDAPLAAQFDILNRSSSRRVGIVNGRTSEVSEWQYQLMPKAAGEFTIPPLRVGDRQANATGQQIGASQPLRRGLPAAKARRFNGQLVVDDRAHGVADRGVGSVLIGTDPASASQWFLDDLSVTRPEGIFGNGFEDTP